MTSLSPSLPDEIRLYNPDTQEFEIRNSAYVLIAKEVPDFRGGFRGSNKYSGTWVDVAPPNE